MLSNSDCLGKNGTDRFFDDLYEDYNIDRVWASRNVNANGAKRGKLTEILVRNYAWANRTHTNIPNTNNQLRLAL